MIEDKFDRAPQETARFISLLAAKLGDIHLRCVLTAALVGPSNRRADEVA